MNKGKFIVLDGIDGSGKGTQTKLLVDRLRQEGLGVEMADFPQYGNWSCEFVERYLRGEFGGLHEVEAKKASLFYALDRYAASFTIRKHLESGDIIIANRYVSANKGHQLGKIQDKDSMLEYLNWINELEYGILGIPIPDATIFLHMPPHIGQKLVDKKEGRNYLQGKKKDLHEADINHLNNAERAYFFCIEHDKRENWKIIFCSEEGEPKSIESIHDETYGLVRKIID